MASATGIKPLAALAAYSGAKAAVIGCNVALRRELRRTGVRVMVVSPNMVRTAIEQICMETIQLCERSVGTRGLLPPHPMERIIRDLSLYLRQPVFDAALANVGQYALAQAVPARRLWLDQSSR